MVERPQGPAGRSEAGAGRTGAPAGRRERDRGSGTILVVSLMGVIWLVGSTLMTAGGVRAARHRAHAAADMAALAAAERAVQGEPDACRFAAKVALDMGARLSRCTLTGHAPSVAAGPSGGKGSGMGSGMGEGQIADVSVTLVLRSLGLIGTLRISARARAGPVPTSGPP
jgi:secretion/DNA translocation related TadE-like protein